MKINSFLRLILSTSLVCGLEFCAATAFTYIPPILLKAGFRESSMSWLMGCGPLMGFLLLPVIGQASDRCRSSFGKRRPFIFGFSTMIFLCLVIIPNVEQISKVLHVQPVALLILAITCVLFDFSSQACLNPCEALIYDQFKGTSEEKSCFYVYSFMTSIGGCLGYLITATNWNDSFLHWFIQGQEKLTFLIVLSFFIVTLLISLVFGNENLSSSSEIIEEKFNGNSKPTDDQHCCPLDYVRFSLLIIIDSIKTILTMPLVLRRLTLAECCSWSALMTFNIFYTDFVGQTIYLGVPNAVVLSVERLRYDQGVRVASYGLFLHCLVAALFTPFLKLLINRFGIHLIFSLSMIIFASSMLVIYISRSIFVVNLMASLTGLITASLTSIPYILVAIYYKQREIYFADNPLMQSKGIGSILGILDSTYFASQIVSSLFTGYIISLFPSSLSYIGTSFFLSICSLWFIKRIVTDETQLKTLMKIPHVEITDSSVP